MKGVVATLARVNCCSLLGIGAEKPVVFSPRLHPHSRLVEPNQERCSVTLSKSVLGPKSLDDAFS